MKKVKVSLLLLLLSLFIPSVAFAENEGSGDNNNGSYTTCGSECVGIMRSGSVGGVRITFVDENGVVLPESGGKSYDFLTKNRFSSISFTYNVYEGDRNKFAMLSGGNYVEGKKSSSDFINFGKIVQAYKNLGGHVTGAIATNGGFTGGNHKTGFDKETQFFIGITKSTNPYAAQDLNAFIKAVAENVAGLDVDKLSYKLAESCRNGTQLFMIMEPLLFFSGKEGKMGSSLTAKNFLGTTADVAHFFPSFTGYNPPLHAINAVAYSMYYNDPVIPAFKAAIPVANGAYHIQTPTDLLTNQGIGLNVDWITDPGLLCGSCDFVGDKFSYDNKLYPGDLEIPAKYPDIYHFAYDDKENGGAGCCELLKDKIVNKPEWLKWYKELCDDNREDCCTEPYTPEPKEWNINNCCEEDTISTVNENLINDLFCYDNEKKVKFFWKKCDVPYDYYKDSKVDIDSKYCEMYCSQRLILEQPGALTGTAGKYFKLGKTSHGSTGPYAEGYRRCRIQIKYDEWLTDYKAEVQSEVTNYNEFQRASAEYETYKNAKANKTSVTKNVTFTLPCTKEETISGCTVCTGVNTPAGCKTSCTTTSSSSQTKEYSITYDKYHFTKKFTYGKVKVQETGYTKIEIVGDGKGQIEHQDYSTYKLKDGLATAQSKASSDLKCPSGYTAGSMTRTNIDDETWPDEDVVSLTSTKEGQLPGKEDAIKTSAKNAKLKEQALDKCDHYFDGETNYPAGADVNTNYKGTKVEESFDFKPEASFTYSQVYREADKKGSLQEASDNVEFDKNCTYEKILYSPGEEEISADVYSDGEIGSGIQAMKDFNDEVDFKFDENGGGHTSYIHKTFNADKKFSTDVKYKAVCTFNEKSNPKHTLVPSGAVQKQSEIKNVTIHDTEYKIYLTTLDGKYETFWNIVKLGHEGTLDKYFQNGGKTCAKEEVDASKALTCTIEVKHSIVYVGTCYGSNGTDVTIKKEDCIPTKDGYAVYNFKIVDPLDFFPSGTSTPDGAIAYNWTNEEEGKKAYKEITDKAKVDQTYAPSNISYQFTLNPTDMKKIKNYNTEKEKSYEDGGYSDFNLTCDCPTEVITDSATNGKACVRCKSTFIKNLSENKIYYDGTSHEIKAWPENLKLNDIRNNKIWNAGE